MSKILLALALFLSTSLHTEASTSGIGAVLIVPHNFDYQLDLLRRMRADTVRIHMYYDPHTRYQVFDGNHIAALHRIGIRTFILRTSEAPSWEEAAYQVENTFVHLAWQYPDSHFVFEVGNEPNLAGKDAYHARYDYLMLIRHVKPRYAHLTNVSWSASMSTVYHRDGSLADVYFDRLMRDAGDGLGTLVEKYDSISVHGYGYHSLHRSDGAAPYAVYDWVRGWHQTIPIHFTESGIDGEQWPSKAHLLREAAVSRPADVRTMVFFTLSPDGSWPTYAITPEAANIIGNR